MAESEGRPEVPDAAPQLAVTDVRRVVSSIVPLGTGDGNLGRTNFENRRLNEMVAMVENAKPADLEAAADALWRAAGDIDDIGEDIKKYAERVDWEGDTADAFRRWATDLAKNTLQLGEYTSTAGMQLKAAAMGLASVKSGMPPRDPTEGLGFGVLLSEVPTPAQVDGNPAYEAAKEQAASKREEGRQEAIIQMNKLSSYYQVSRDTMAAQKPPTFAPMPDVGVPSANDTVRDSVILSPSGGPPPVERVARSGPEGAGHVTAPEGVSASSVQPADSVVRTEMNSATSSVLNSADSGPRNGPGESGAGVATGGSSAPTALPAGPASLLRPGGRNAAVQGGRPMVSGASATGSIDPRGIAGGSAPGAAGRQGASGIPARSGRTEGIFGGTSSRAGEGPVGGRGAGSGHPMTSRGPVGPVSDGAGNNAGRRVAFDRSGVVGNSGSASSAGGRGRGEFTPGGTGLARGAPVNTDTSRRAGATGIGARRPGAKESTPDESRRPDYLVEEAETWKDRRNTAPPVVD